MTHLGLREKDPADIRNYTINLSRWLGSATIDSATLTVPSGITKVADSNDATRVSVRLSGGTAGHVYTVCCVVVTSNGQTRKFYFDIKVQ